MMVLEYEWILDSDKSNHGLSVIIVSKFEM
jgi:hypothetical protein